ncbi:ribonucleoside-diphosphate reductase 2 alpha chain [Escherichia coli]|uniref:Ribonucleoside-diphosphate reductase 2 alpha chain n=1 Tax=Escherichia coli TaxID=562 RepID=A0A377K1U5_ECOLX|nr:ribonucleoside-diphosphate reductase 2 alpha chain [Escherichia coli]
MGRRKHWISPISISIPSPGTHCVPRCCWRANAGETFAGFKQSRYASGEYFSQYLQGNWQPKTAKVGELFARSGITLPTREMWAQLRDERDALWYLQPESPGGAANRFYLLYQPCHVEYSSDCGEK